MNNILEELKKRPEETIVIGDRIKQDLLPAKELGLFTIQMRWGRGKRSFSSTEYKIDTEIYSLLELPEAIQNITGKIRI